MKNGYPVIRGSYIKIKFCWKIDFVHWWLYNVYRTTVTLVFPAAISFTSDDYRPYVVIMLLMVEDIVAFW